MLYNIKKGKKNRNRNKKKKEVERQNLIFPFFFFFLLSVFIFNQDRSTLIRKKNRWKIKLRYTPSNAPKIYMFCTNHNQHSKAGCHYEFSYTCIVNDIYQVEQK